MTDTCYTLKSSRGRSPNHYHTNPDCQNFPNHEKEIPMAEAEKMGLKECSFCADTCDNPSTDPLKYIRKIEEQVADD